MTSPMPENTLFSLYAGDDVEALLDGTAPVWREAAIATADRLWSGRPVGADDESAALAVSSVWTEAAAYFRFDCRFSELNVNPDLGLDGPIDRLWEYDVVEVFLRPPGGAEYLEIEVSPLGQWVDLRIIEPRRRVDLHWRSHLRSVVQLDRTCRRWLTLLRLPWEPLLQVSQRPGKPAAGDSWRVNFFRAAGFEPNRLYLSWRPTLTLEPDFHVPDAFGHLFFLKQEQLR